MVVCCDTCPPVLQIVGFLLVQHTQATSGSLLISWLALEGVLEIRASSFLCVNVII